MKIKRSYFIFFLLLFFFSISDAKAPHRPRHLTAIAISCSQVQLSWEASRLATGYDVYTTNGKFIISVSSNGCTIALLKPIASYIFIVRSTNGGKNSSFAVSNVVTTQMCDSAFHWGENTYPWKFTQGQCDMKVLDPYYFNMFSCASYVAWKINNLLGDTSTSFKGYADFPFNDFMNGGTIGVNACTCNSSDPVYRMSDACHWAIALKAVGYVVDNIPAVGAIAQWDAFENDIGGHGHVAFVDSVSGNEVFLSNYNGIDYIGRDVPCHYGYFRIDMAKPYNKNTNRLPGRFIHIDQVRKIERKSE